MKKFGTEKKTIKILIEYLGAIYQMWRFDREAQHACFDNRAIGFGGEVDSYGHGRNSVTPEQVGLIFYITHNYYS